MIESIIEKFTKGAPSPDKFNLYDQGSHGWHNDDNISFLHALEKLNLSKH